LANLRGALPVDFQYYLAADCKFLVYLPPAGARAVAEHVRVLARPAEQTPLIAGRAVGLLHQAGIPKNEIRFVIGPGSHRPLTDEEIVKKVGADIAAAYEITNHDFMSGNLRALGNLDEGMPIYINPVVADADFKICLGGIYPHKAVGFGGGAKLIVPGVSGFSTMFHFHNYYPG